VFDATDPRSALSASPATSAASDAHYGGSQYARFYELEPDMDEGVPTWWVRGQNVVVAYSTVESNAGFEHRGIPDEWMLLIPDPAARVQVTAGSESADVAGETLSIVPPGDATITVGGAGQVVRIFPSTATGLAARTINNAAYDTPRPNVAPLTRWPDPPDGFRLRTYSLDVPADPNRFGRIWRCTTIMVNYLDRLDGPRDSSKLSPHDHADFEQISLALSGDYLHHLRWPWGVDLAEWRADEHEQCSAPSIVVIPPPSLHTSQAIGAGVNQLVDIFAPPRADFSLRDKWVLNADEYPLPPGLGEA
jgi:hypothetical protein